MQICEVKDVQYVKKVIKKSLKPFKYKNIYYIYIYKTSIKPIKAVFKKVSCYA